MCGSSGIGAAFVRTLAQAGAAVVIGYHQGQARAQALCDELPALAHGRQLAREGADILDIGGESTRPGHTPVPAQVEIERIEAVIESLRPYAQSIILADPGCTDATLERARRVFPVVSVRVPADMFDIRGRFDAIRRTCGPLLDGQWVFPMSCSERFTDALGTELVRLINAAGPKLSAVSVYRQSFTFGMPSHHRMAFFLLSALFRLEKARLIRFDRVDWEQSRMHHEFPLQREFRHHRAWVSPFFGRVLLHFRSGDLTDFEKKHTLYAINEAEELYAKGVRPSLWFFFKNVVLTAVYFLPSVFISREASIAAAYHVFYKFQVWARLYFLWKK